MSQTHVCIQCSATYPALPNDLGDCPRCHHAGVLAGALEAGTRKTLGPTGPEVEITRDLDAHAAAALHRLARWVVSLDEPLRATDREIADALGDGSSAGAQRVRRWRLAAGIPARTSRPKTKRLELRLTEAERARYEAAARAALGPDASLSDWIRRTLDAAANADPE